MKLGERKHDGWCATETHTTGKCNCHLSEIAKLEAENETLQAELGRVVIAIKKGLTDKPALEKIEAHIIDLLKSQGYFDDALLTGEDKSMSLSDVIEDLRKKPDISLLTKDD